MISLLKLTPYIGGDVALSPNFGARLAPGIEGIVLHATADEGNEAGTLTWLMSPKSRASCHLLVNRAGEVTRLVGDQLRAWHAGASSWRGSTDVNSITLGIEIANRNDGEPYTDPQYHRVAEIVAHYCRQGLTCDDVVSHSAIAQERRTDPLGWDWERFRALVEQQLATADCENRVWAAYERRKAERLAALQPRVTAALPPIPVPVPRLAAGKASAASPSRPPHATARLQPAAKSVTAPSGARAPLTPPPVPANVPAGPTAKTPVCSRTLWLNGLTVLAASGVIVGETLDLAFSVGLTMPEELAMWALFGVGVVNIVLRYQTACPIRGPLVYRSPPVPVTPGSARAAGAGEKEK
jgi:N-acetyl-anhydromuramyl-L-alanine amidase AmpD